jgi:hypothetical protein
MELITTQIEADLEKIIQGAFESVKDSLIVENKRINHVNIYHKDWVNNSYQDLQDLINILSYNYNIDIKKIISMGFICSQVNSHDQHFHIDYEGNTETYFIPMIELNDKNGTEYVEFFDKNQNIDLFSELLSITNLYIDKSQVTEHFDNLNIPRENYKIKFLNGNKFSMVKMPYYVFHRGQSNKTCETRIMFQIIIAKNDKANVCSGMLIDDSELDEETYIVNKLLNSRKNNQ